MCNNNDDLLDSTREKLMLIWYVNKLRSNYLTQNLMHQFINLNHIVAIILLLQYGSLVQKCLIKYVNLFSMSSRHIFDIVIFSDMICKSKRSCTQVK